MKKIISIFLAAAMVLQFSLSSVVLAGEVTAPAITAVHGETIADAGNITAEGTAVEASGESSVNAGDITGCTDSSLSYTRTYAVITEDSQLVASSVTSPEANGIMATGKSTVTVNGPVTAKECGIYMPNDGEDSVNQSSVTVKGDLKVEDGLSFYADEGPALFAEGNGQVEITGNIYSGFDGISIYDQSTVTVRGDMNIVGTGAFTEDDGKVIIEGSIYSGTKDFFWTGEGIVASGSSEATVGGDIFTTNGDGVYTYDIETDIEEKVTDTWEADGDTYRTFQIFSEYSPNHATVTVNGNVAAESGSAVHSEGSSDVTVLGSISSGSKENQVIYAAGASRVNIQGDVDSQGAGIYTVYSVLTQTEVATQKLAKSDEGEDLWEDYDVYLDPEETGACTAQVTVGGHVNAAGTAVYASDASTVTISGDVTSETAEAVEMEWGASVTVEGNVTGGTFEEDEDTESAVLSDGEAKGEYAKGAATINLVPGPVTASLLIKGSVTALGSSVPLLFNILVDKNAPSALPEEMPEIRTYELVPAGSLGEYFDVNIFENKEIITESEETGLDRLVRDISEEERAAMLKALPQIIQYIIRVDNPENGSIILEGVTRDEENDLMLAREGDRFIVKVNAEDGYAVEGVEAGNADLADNGDGTWTVTVKQGGGVTISAAIVKK